MCGISGYINIHGHLDNNTCEATEMVNMEKHRGPDDFGLVGISYQEGRGDVLHQNESCSLGYNGMLGFARLSIRDLTLNGHQPMQSNDGKVILSFNGEIYNANDYREELLNDGVKFKSTTDTEIVLYLYLKYGIDKMSKMLNGMFGISICDLRIRKLFLLRDRMGIKPLYYTVTEKRFAYASEMKSFLALKDFQAKLRIDGLTEHLTFYKPYDGILFEGVQQLEPGEILTVNLDAFSMTKNRFFDINDYVRPSDSEDGLPVWKDRVKEELKKCVLQQKVSDAKLGCQLSGGVDSSVVTYFAAEDRERDSLQDSISIVFDGDEAGFSEEKFVDVVGDKLGIDCHKKIIDKDYVLKNYEKALWHADSVIGRPNSIGLMLLTQEAKKYVTVLLSGEGSDELLGGYSMFTQGKEVEEYLRGHDEMTVETVRNQPELIKSFAEYAVISQQKTNTTLCSAILPDYDSTKIINERIERFEHFDGTNFDKQIKYALSTYLPELLLCQDKMSMANSIENRVPILDNDFIDFAFTIPEKFLLRERDGKWEGKYLLKEVCADLFGEQFAYRRKMGFGLPYYRYFQDKRFREYFYDIILPGTKKRGIMDAAVLENWYLNLDKKCWGESELFWKVCSFEVWCQMFLERREWMQI